MTQVDSDLVSRARAMAVPGTRRLLGIAGPPGSGTSTLAAHLAAELGPERAVVVPMDGFHLAQRELARLGRADRKGAPDTFDPAGYLALLQRLAAAEPLVWAPAFDRRIEEPVAGSIAVPAQVPLVITEGNYLLLSAAPWAGVRPLLHACWYVDVSTGERVARLTRRHVEHGRSPADAASWAAGSDEDNARLVRADRHRADLHVTG